MNINISKIMKPSMLAIIVLGSGCGGGGGNALSSGNHGSPVVQPPVVTPPAVMKPAELNPDYSADPQLPSRASPDWDKAVDASRFLAQASFGATAKDIDYIVKNGKSAWLDNQFALSQTSQLEFLDKRLVFYGFQPVPPVPYFDDPNDVWGRYILRQDIWWETAVWGQDQLRQRVAFSLSQILVVSQLASDLYARERGFANYHDILARHAFGNYGDLLLDISLNPIMGIYLSALNNPKADDKLNIRPDENYAREILQLFSIGLNELNADGSLKLNSDSKPIPTFDQDVVKEFARVFTGWSLSETNYFGEFGTYAPPKSNAIPMKAYPAFHDSGAKRLLNGQVTPSGKTPLDDMDAAINNIMTHNNVAPFISKKLIQYLITSNPSPAYIERVSKAFNDNGKGVKGDMKAVIKAIYLDDEARTPPQPSQDYYGKLKEYPLLVSGLWRAFNAQGVPVIHNGKGVNTIRYMNGTLNAEQEAFFAPSVFNFYQSEYSPLGLAKHKLLAPEFQIFNASSAVLQANLLAKIIYHRDTNDPNLFKDKDANQSWGASIGWNNPPVHAKLNFSDEIALAKSPEKLVDHLNLLLTQGQITAEDSALIAAHISLLNEPVQRVYEAVFLIAVSPEYAIQR